MIVAIVTFPVPPDVDSAKAMTFFRKLM